MPNNFIPKGPFKIDKNALKKLGVESDIIVATARAYVEADVHVQPGSNNYSLLQQEGVFARVGVAVLEGGGYWILLKKVHDIWVPLFGGQDLPLKDMGEKYGLPSGWYLNE